jgi:hypothetical protein
VIAETIVLSREELYALVWETPLVALALRYGVTGAELAAWCRRLRVPYPPPGHWTRKAHGKESPRPPLGPGPADLDVARLQPKDPTERRRRRDGGLAPSARPPAKELEEKPHPLIAAWLEDRAQHIKRDPGMPDWTAAERRRLSILDRLFKALEPLGYKPEAETLYRLWLNFGEERVDIALREKLKRVPYSPSLYSFGGSYKMAPAGVLLFTIEARLGDPPLPSEWVDEPGRPLEQRRDEIVSTLAQARPILLDLRAKREAAERQRREAFARRRAEEERRERERQRWRRFSDLARQWREAQDARALLEALKAASCNAHALVGERSLAEWLRWAAEQADAHDPTVYGAEETFRRVDEHGEDDA